VRNRGDKLHLLARQRFGTSVETTINPTETVNNRMPGFQHRLRVRTAATAA
jgi:hypothetical protein